MHLWGTYVHMCTKYEVSMSIPASMSIPVAGGGEVCTDDDADTEDAGQ